MTGYWIHYLVIGFLVFFIMASVRLCRWACQEIQYRQMWKQYGYGKRR